MDAHSCTCIFTFIPLSRAIPNFYLPSSLSRAIPFRSGRYSPSRCGCGAAGGVLRSPWPPGSRLWPSCGAAGGRRRCWGNSRTPACSGMPRNTQRPTRTHCCCRWRRVSPSCCCCCCLPLQVLPRLLLQGSNVGGSGCSRLRSEGSSSFSSWSLPRLPRGRAALRGSPGRRPHSPRRRPLPSVLGAAKESAGWKWRISVGEISSG